MGLERRGRVKRSHDRGNWEQEDFDACDRHAVRLACLLDGSRMNREVHVRFCERPVVQSRRPTHPGLIRTEFSAGTAGSDAKGPSGPFERGCLGPGLENSERHRRSSSHSFGS
jgi:hypothetical protein